MQLQTVLDTLHEDVRDIKPVPALLRATLHPALLMHDVSVNDAIPNRLSDNILRIFFRVQVQLDADIAEADTSVR